MNRLSLIEQGWIESGESMKERYFSRVKDQGRRDLASGFGLSTSITCRGLDCVGEVEIWNVTKLTYCYLRHSSCTTKKSDKYFSDINVDCPN